MNTEFNAPFFSLCTLLCIFSLCTLLFAFPTHAQEIGFTIDPPVSHLAILPGRTATIPLTISSSGDPVPASITFSPFYPTGTTGEVNLVDCTQPGLSSCLATSWFSIASASGSLNSTSEKTSGIFLNSKQPTNLTLRVSVPENTPSGDYPMTTLVRSEVPAKLTTNAHLIPQVGAHIIVSVLPSDGHYEQSGKILSFSSKEGMSIGFGKARIKLYDSFDQIPLVLTVQNTGDLLIKPSGVIQSVGKSLPIRYEFAPQYILGHLIRVLQVADTPNGTSVILPRGFYVGRYTFKGELSLSEGSTPVTVETTFIALPLKLLLTLLLAIMIIVGLKRRKTLLSSNKATA